jgi:hypothetical protein
MNEVALQMRHLLTKHKLKADDLHNEFDVETLVLMGKGCMALYEKIECELKLLDSVYVKAIALDDMKTVTSNLEVITSAINLKNLKIEGFCFN